MMGLGIVAAIALAQSSAQGTRIEVSTNVGKLAANFAGRRVFDPAALSYVTLNPDLELALVAGRHVTLFVGPSLGLHSRQGQGVTIWALSFGVRLHLTTQESSAWISAAGGLGGAETVWSERWANAGAVVEVGYTFVLGRSFRLMLGAGAGLLRLEHDGATTLTVLPSLRISPVLAF